VAPLIEEVAVVETHPLADGELPSGVNGAIMPVVLALSEAEGVAGGASGNAVVRLVFATAGAVTGAVGTEIEDPVTGGGTGIGGAVTSPRTVAEIGGVTAVVLPVADIEVAPGAVMAGVAIVPIADVEVTATGAVVGTIVVVGAGNGEQLTLVPAMVGSSASGSGARVVTGAPGWVAAENGLGPVSGDDTIAPGVDGIPMAVVPMVETCATQLLLASSNAVIAYRKRRMESVPASWSVQPAAFAERPCCRRPD
jgi:hypothetical protein